MASLINMSYKGWQQYESGDSIPGGKVLQSLANLGFSVNWILTGEGEMRTADIKNTVESTGQVNDKGSHPMISETILNRLNIPTLTYIQMQPVIDAVMEVMISDHSGVKLALTQNALMFQEMVRNAKKLEKLEKRIEDIESVNKKGETDFKTAESQGEKKKAGGVN